MIRHGMKLLRKAMATTMTTKASFLHSIFSRTVVDLDTRTTSTSKLELDACHIFVHTELRSYYKTSAGRGL